MRLQRNKEGMPKFSQRGRSVLRVAREVNDQIRLVRDNFTFGLMAYAENIRKTMPAEYKARVDAAANAGAPIGQRVAPTVGLAGSSLSGRGWRLSLTWYRTLAAVPPCLAVRRPPAAALGRNCRGKRVFSPSGSGML